MRYFVDSAGRILGLCVTGDNAVNEEQYRILDLDLDPVRAQYSLYNENGMITLDVLRYEPVQRKKLEALYEASKDLVLADRWENFTTSERNLVATYRTALRNLPSHPSWPDLLDSDWPVAPNV